MIFSKITKEISLIIIPWLCVAIMRLFGPISFKELSEKFIIFIIAFGVVNVIGYLIGRFVRVRSLRAKKVHFVQLKDRNSGNFFIFLVALVYIALMVMDFFLNKGGTLTTITEVRESDNITGGRMSIIGGIMALTSAAPYILLCMTSYSRQNGSALRSNLPFVVAMLGIAIGFLSGGRNSFLIGIIVFGFQSLYMRRYNNQPKIINDKRFGLRIVLAASILFSFYIFLERETQQGASIRDVLSIFSFKWNVTVANLSADSTLIQGIYAIMVMAIFYATHALTYIDQYFTQDVSPLLFGAYNFPIMAKIIDFIYGGGVFTGVANSLIVAGVYITLPGSLYMDFGYIGAIVFGLILSILTGHLNNSKVVTSFRRMQLLSVLSAIWILSPIYSVFAMANGFSYIFLLIVLSIITKIRINMFVKKKK